MAMQQYPDEVHEPDFFFLSTAERAIKHCRSSGCHRKMRINHQDIKQGFPQFAQKSHLMTKGNKSLEQIMQILIHKRTVPFGNEAVKQQKLQSSR